MDTKSTEVDTKSNGMDTESTEMDTKIARKANVWLISDVLQQMASSFLGHYAKLSILLPSPITYKQALKAVK